MKIKEFLEDARQQFQSFISSGWCIQWRGEDRNWTIIETEEGPSHLDNRSGLTYFPDRPDWAFVKTAAMLWLVAPYFYGAHCLKDCGKVFYDGVNACQLVATIYREKKNEAGFNFPEFAIEQAQQFFTTRREVKPLLKNLCLFSLFYFDPGLPIIQVGIIKTAFLALFTITPLEARVLLNELENQWRPEGVEPVKRGDELSVQETISHICDGSFSLAHIFGWQVVGEVEKEKVE